MAAEFKVILTIDSQGNAKIEEVKRALQDVGDTAAKSGQAGAAGADEFAGALMRQLGIAALVTAGLYKLEQAAVGAFKAGIQSVDDFKLNTIGVAATLTDLGQAGADSQKDYARNIAYSKDMYNELELAAARHFASGKDMVQAWNILAQKGVVLRKEEIDDLGTIVDKIKLATQGQVQGIQIAQEIRAMLSGQARQTDQLAMMVRDRYGAAWKDILEQHRQAGDLISWMANEFKGLKYAQEDIVTTLTSQKTTLDTLLSQVGRGGLAGAYADIVGFVKNINDYLREHRSEVQEGIYAGWVAVKDLVGGVVGFIREIANIANKGIVVPITFTIGGAAKYLAEGAGAQGDYGFGALTGDKAPGPKYTTPEQSKYWSGLAAAKGGIGYVLTPQGIPILISQEETTPAATRKMGGADEKGGGGKGRDTTETLENLILQLRQEEAKLTEGAFGGIDAWYTKITEKIKKLAMDDKQLKDGMLTASELKAAKEGKVSDDLNKKYLSATHQTAALQIAEDLKRLSDVKGHVAEEDKAREIMYQHALDRSDKLALAENQQQKTYYDSLAQSSILIKDQVIWKEQSWQLEKKISQEQLEQWFKGKDITQAQKEDYRAMLALTNAAKEYNLERQKAVDLGTLEGWAIERAGEAIKKEKTTIKDLMTGLESGIGSAFSSGIQGVLSKDKQSLQKIGSTMFSGFVLEIQKGSLTRSFNELAKLMAPETKSTTAGGTTDAAGKALGTAAKDLEKSGLGLNSAGLQLGLSAGGLLLSGIGIATNSQMLVYAGTVLQMAGLAIQLYEALTAATTTATMTTAAGALTGSAVALTSAAGALVVAAGGSSGSAAGGILSGLTSIVGLFLHHGGLVAHSGLLVAHGGLNLDERHVIAQVGEGIIKRDAMAEYARHGISFDMLNTGRLPVGGAGGGGNQVVFNIGDIHINPPQGMTDIEADRMVRRQIMPAIEKVMGNRGLNLIG